jgi:hypothetical protein
MTFNSQSILRNAYRTNPEKVGTKEEKKITTLMSSPVAVFLCLV